MPKPSTTAVTDILHELTLTVKELGPGAVMSLLRNARENVSPNEHIKFVVINVCNTLSLKVEDLQQKNGDHINYAKGFIIHYLRKDFEIEWAEIKLLLGHRNQNWLYQLMKLVHGLKQNLAAHATWCNAKTILDKIIKEYKSKINWQ